MGIKVIEAETPPARRELSRAEFIDLIPAASLRMDEYQGLSALTSNTGNQLPREQYQNVALGLAGEAGEFADAIKKAVHHGHGYDPEHLTKELGDILFYVQWGCTLLGTTMGEVGKDNLLKLAKRYPDGFSSQASLERRDMLEEAQEHDAQ